MTRPGWNATAGRAVVWPMTDELAAVTFAKLALGRRVVQTLTPLAEFLSVDIPDRIEDGIAQFVGAVADQAEIAVLNEEHTMADAIGRLDVRFQDAGLDPDGSAGVIDHIRAEVGEIQRAFSDIALRGNDGDREHALTEIGDAMLLLARLAMRLGARPLDPLVLAVRKAEARLRAFDGLRGSSTEEPGFVWRMAKRLADK